MPPDSIVNPESHLYSRVDLMLTGAGIQPLSESVVGADPSDRLMPSGLWPTDHASLVATLGLKPLPDGH